jgi:hypothetical protein
MRNPDQKDSVRGGNEQAPIGKGVNLANLRPIELGVAVNLCLFTMKDLPTFTQSEGGKKIQGLYAGLARELLQGYTNPASARLVRDRIATECKHLLTLVSPEEYNPTQRFNITAKFFDDAAKALGWHDSFSRSVRAVLLVNRTFTQEQKSVLQLAGSPNINDLAIDAGAVTLMVGAKARGLFSSVDKLPVLSQASR